MAGTTFKQTRGKKTLQKFKKFSYLLVINSCMFTAWLTLMFCINGQHKLDRVA